MLGTIDWDVVEGLDGSALKSTLFDILQEASWRVQTASTDDPDLLSVIPRLTRLLERNGRLADLRQPVSTLARSVGLWNYIDEASADQRDRLVAEMASLPELGIVLHREQVAALKALLDGENLILSAPTSFGKSILIDALLLSGRYNRIAIVLPTIALLDEFRRRLSQRFGHRYDVIMHHSERSLKDCIIFLGTQERLINRDDIDQLDLLVVDEFYKLDPSRRDERSITLNAAVYGLLHISSQFFFLGPNIDSVRVSGDSRWQFSFLRTRFLTVAVDTFDLTGEPNKEERLVEEIRRPTNWPALVFV